MTKTSKAVLLVSLGAVLAVGGATTANAASKKTKVLSTVNIAQINYHGKKGNIYSSAKLTKVRYRMDKYKYTTWHATKRATIKKNGKMASLTYVKAGVKKGWIYSKYLTKGKAPVNRAKQKVTQLENDISNFNRIAMASSSFDLRSGDFVDYSDMGTEISLHSSYYYDNSNRIDDKTALLSFYSLFKGRFSSTQNTNLAAMATQLKNTSMADNDEGTASSTLADFGAELGDLVSGLK